jgi:retinol dehydrogenase 12
MPSQNSTSNQPLAGERTALITGANTGIGLVTARHLALQGYHLFVACRSKERAQPALDAIREAGAQARMEVKVEALALDLGDFQSVRHCAADFLARNLPLHLLVNNAGLAGTKGLTASGFELAFGVNHLGHFLLTTLLLDRLKASAPARIVTVASRAHTRSTGLDWSMLQQATVSRTAIKEYADSKLANVLFSAELGKRLAGSGVSSYALHPGVVASDIWRSVPWPFSSLIKLAMISTEEGARTSLHCATSAEVASQSGLYYDHCRVKSASTLGRDPKLAQELWQRSEAWVSA